MIFGNPHEVHVWLGELTLTPEQEEDNLRLLSPDERERASRFRFVVHKHQFIAARSQLRQILSGYLHIPPEDITFGYTKYHKPYLQAPLNSRLQFNISHSENMAAYALTLDHAIGIDIEKTKENYNPDVAKRFFSPEENAILEQTPLIDRARTFYCIWSRKEALIKAAGKGLFIPLAHFSVSTSSTPKIIALENEAWSLCSLALHPEYQLAIATLQPINHISYWTFSDH